METPYKIDAENNRIELLDNRFYEFNGQLYPSVTTILDAYPKGPAFFEWLKMAGEKADEIRDQFGKRGSVVHNLTEQYDNGFPVTLMSDNGPLYSSLEWAMFERYIDFSNRFAPDILGVELNYASEVLKFGGTLDRVIKLNGKLVLIDIKTSNYLHNHFWLQMAAYVKLFEEKNPGQKIDQIAILWLNAKTRTEGKKDDIQGIGWQLKFSEKSIEEHYELFQATHKLWSIEFGSLKPKNQIYQLKHQKNGTEKK
jgi:hypothetical protein